MPSPKERVNIYLDPAMASIVRRASEVRGVSRAVVITDLLDAVGPQLERMVEMLELAARAPKEMKDQVVRALEAAQQTIEPLVNATDDASAVLQMNIEDAIREATERTKADLNHTAA